MIQQVSRYSWFAVLILGSQIVQCGQRQAPSVAEVGSHQITAPSLRKFVAGVPPGLRTEKTGDAARRHYLQALVNRQLLLMEARVRGLDSTEDVRTAIKEAIDTHACRLYWSQEILPQIQGFPEEDVREMFTMHGFDQERLLNIIMVRTRAQIDTVLSALAAGRPFEEVAEAYSVEKRSAGRGGLIGFISMFDLPRFPIPHDLFGSLPLGEISKPLRTGAGWYIFRFTENRPTSYEKYGSYLRAHLAGERRLQSEREHLESLKESYNVQFNPESLEELKQTYAKNDPQALAGSATVLYAFDVDQITVADVQSFLQRPENWRRLGDDTQASLMVEWGVLWPALLRKAAREAGIYDRPEVLEVAKSSEEEILLETLKEVAVMSAISVSKDEAKQYYENHPELFRREGNTWIEEVLLPTEAEALQVCQELEGGKSFNEFTHRSLRRGAQGQLGQFHFHPLERSHYPRLVPAIMTAPAEKIVGPVEVNGGWSVFRLLRRESETIEPYVSAQRQVYGLLRAEQEGQRLEVLLNQLREKYTAEVKIHETRLVSALPDSLLANR